jgi:hypothetical protein
MYKSYLGDLTNISFMANKSKRSDRWEQKHSRRLVSQPGILLEWRWVKKRPWRGGGRFLDMLGGTPDEAETTQPLVGAPAVVLRGAG